VAHVVTVDKEAFILAFTEFFFCYNFCIECSAKIIELIRFRVVEERYVGAIDVAETFPSFHNSFSRFPGVG